MLLNIKRPFAWEPLTQPLPVQGPAGGKEQTFYRADAGDQEGGPGNGAVQHLVRQEFVLLRQAETLDDSAGQILQRFGGETRVQMFVGSV